MFLLRSCAPSCPPPYHVFLNETMSLIEKIPFHIRSLSSGGLIPNYHCVARCRHCLYACGPQRSRDYISAARAREACAVIKTLYCNRVHIGGGEPLLQPDLLADVLDAARMEGITVEYVETNAAWFTDPDSARPVLEDMMHRGVDTLLISISPFHNEFVPYWKTRGLMETCLQVGMGVFPWVLAFAEDIERFAPSRTHALEEYRHVFGPDYVRTIPSRYWITFGGRALDTFSSLFPQKRSEEIVADAGQGCLELMNTDHFHVDLYGSYVPSLCAGLSFEMSDLGSPFDPETYPLLFGLFHTGVGFLYDHARSRHGYVPGRCFTGKCDLCTDIRRFLVLDCGLRSRELQPLGFYENL